MTSRQHFVRYRPDGPESGPFDDDDRQALDDTARVRLYWRTGPAGR